MTRRRERAGRRCAPLSSAAPLRLVSLPLPPDARAARRGDACVRTVRGGRTSTADERRARALAQTGHSLAPIFPTFPSPPTSALPLARRSLPTAPFRFAPPRACAFFFFFPAIAASVPAPRASPLLLGFPAFPVPPAGPSRPLFPFFRSVREVQIRQNSFLHRAARRANARMRAWGRGGSRRRRKRGGKQGRSLGEDGKQVVVAEQVQPAR